ncbi:unnamed protein product [Leptidea sinapis]|uniref:FP protein C-terminal domain-containing protein n=1 Tax=Leptidea sinapis TaxID=189913 RepID=A0A5E4PWW2_9NEOP|nr:unnamed protein product [Leptidea sinapis]
MSKAAMAICLDAKRAHLRQAKRGKAGSLGSKDDNLAVSVSRNDIDVLAINETWLRAGEEGRAPMLPGYRLQHIPRPPFVRSRGGGVGFYTKQNINARTLVHPEDPQHKLDINVREQDILQSDIEISNLPEVAGENPTQTFMVLATRLGVSLKHEEVVFAERIGRMVEINKGENKTSLRLVVRLSRRQLRDELIQSARVRRGATSADLGIDLPPQRFYASERLTPANRKLFYSAREAARNQQWKFTWTKRGRIYIRQGEGKPIHNIRSDDDLARVFGFGSVGSASEG